MPLHVDIGDTAIAEQEDEVQLAESCYHTGFSERAFPKGHVLEIYEF